MKRAGLLLLLGLAPACGNFADPSTVVDLRVLAVETDPSEVVLKVNGLPADPLNASLATLEAITIDPASIPTIHLTPLVLDPRPAAAGVPITYSLTACPNDPYGAAPPAGGGGNVDPSGGAHTTVGSTLCDGARVSWPLGDHIPADGPHDVTLTPAQLLQAFQTDIYLDQYGRPHGGFDLGLPINLELTITSGAGTTVAIKRVLFWAQPLPGQKVNVIPTIPQIVTYPDRTEDWAPLGTQGTLDAGTPAHVPLGGQLWLQPILLDAERESYVTTVIERDPPYLAVPDVVAHERIRYAFYTTAGHFDPARTVSELAPGVTGTVHLESRYVPPSSLDGVRTDASGAAVADVWIVVRDDRGGESWVQRQIVVDPGP
ncbi:MAG TPA: hypothetical protein VHJ20_21980 [Polyangia bacterium]|nr:hypothetical protein [Polyangia bacterium]